MEAVITTNQAPGVDDPPILLALYEALEETIEPEDDDQWQFGEETPAQARAEKRAAMKAIYDLALYYWVSGWLNDQQLEAHVQPTERGYALALQHERLYTCGYEEYAETIRKVAQAEGAGLPANYREFLIFMGGVCVSVQADVLKSLEDERA